jgi:hypothetical protein
MLSELALRQIARTLRLFLTCFASPPNDALSPAKRAPAEVKD